ncbi:MAG: glutaminyl-tRNA synthase (glutamine-hydrolyzing) subunit B [Candidatus Margulisbacteria bacterium GWF2_35_9]|nr:MAG: glutaminyl-tRNA synthase (glutamine-hydrolyzing) subunit B [Candidatus Margulisbacteria bacterium GWF2_35_9]
MSWEVVIGLEIHAQLKTNSKLFCHCSAAFGDTPNTNICPVCTAMPGVLPVLNKKVVDSAIKLGLATNCKINSINEFSRKNYFYPDSPKAYQISQFDKPICLAGYLNIMVNNELRRIDITRIHMEEDAGKLVHQGSDNISGATHSLVDLNRCSVPLLEIVSEPVIRSATEARLYMEKMRQIIRYLDIGDGNMEEGSLRCDANVSIRKRGDIKLGTKTEVKNLNSFKSVEKAINLEIDRQIDILEDGGTIIQETRHYNEATASTTSLRSKEEAHDYRYFPDPDLVPIVIDELWIETIRKELPELPEAIQKRFVNDYNLPTDHSVRLTSIKKLAEDFENAYKNRKNENITPLETANVALKYYDYFLSNNLDFSKSNHASFQIGGLTFLVNTSTVSSSTITSILPDIVNTNYDPIEYVKEKGLAQVSDTGELKSIIQDVIKENPGPAEEIKSGKMQTIGFMMGQIMQKTKGKANPGLANKMLKELLGIS